VERSISLKAVDLQPIALEGFEDFEKVICRAVIQHDKGRARVILEVLRQGLSEMERAILARRTKNDFHNRTSFWRAKELELASASGRSAPRRSNRALGQASRLAGQSPSFPRRFAATGFCNSRYRCRKGLEEGGSRSARRRYISTLGCKSSEPMKDPHRAAPPKLRRQRFASRFPRFLEQFLHTHSDVRTQVRDTRT